MRVVSCRNSFPIELSQFGNHNRQAALLTSLMCFYSIATFLKWFAYWICNWALHYSTMLACRLIWYVVLNWLSLRNCVCDAFMLEIMLRFVDSFFKSALIAVWLSQQIHTTFPVFAATISSSSNFFFHQFRLQNSHVYDQRIFSRGDSPEKHWV